MEMTTILLRTVIMYVFVYLMLRLMGKREIGKLTVFDLVISIMIAEIAVIVIENTDKPLLYAAAPMLMLVLIQMVFAFVTMKNRMIRTWVEGKPSVLIRDGRLNRKEMWKQRYNLDDLMAQLRGNHLTDIGEVELAVLESNGKLSVVPKEIRFGKETGRDAESKESRHEPSGKTSPKIRYELLPVALILDGQIQEQNLEKIGKNRFWLKNRLRERGIDQFRQVFFCSIDHNGKLYVDRKP